MASTVVGQSAGFPGVVAEQDPQQQARVELFAAGLARVTIEPVGPAVRLDEVADRLPFMPPRRFAVAWKVARLGQAQGAVERHPAHHLRMGEVPGLAPHLPDSGVGLAPDAAYEVGVAGEALARLAVESSSGLRVDQGGLEEVAVDVELSLRGGVVAYAYRARAAVAVQLECPLGCALPTV